MIFNRFLDLFTAHRQLETDLEAARRECSFWMARAQQFEVKADAAHGELTSALKKIADENHRAMTGRHIFTEASDVEHSEGGRMVPAHFATGRMQARNVVRQQNREFIRRKFTEIRGNGGEANQTG